MNTNSKLSARPDDLASVAKRLRIETAIQKEAEDLESQIPLTSRLQTAYQSIAQLEHGDQQAETALHARTNSLADQSVEHHADAVADLSRVLPRTFI